MASDAWLGKWRTSLATGFVLSTALGVVLGVIGPFGSYRGGGLGIRVLYWTVSLWAGWLVFGLAVPILARAAVRRRWPLWAWFPATVAVLAIPAAWVGRMLAVAVWPSAGRIACWNGTASSWWSAPWPTDWSCGASWPRGPLWRHPTPLIHAIACRRTWAARSYACGWRTTTCGATRRAGRPWCSCPWDRPWPAWMTSRACRPTGRGGSPEVRSKGLWRTVATFAFGWSVAWRLPFPAPGSAPCGPRVG